MSGFDLTTVDFHGARLVAIKGETDATTLVAMKPVSEGMRLNWDSQRKKLVGHPVLSVCTVNLTVQMPGDDQAREWVFLPLNRLNFWLATIHPNKVPDAETRIKIIEYQTECADALYEHFFAKAMRAAKARRVVNDRRAEEAHLLNKMRGVQGFAGELRRCCGQRYAAAVFPQLLGKLGLQVPDLTPEPMRQGEIFGGAGDFPEPADKRPN
ncbi:phage antirepressor N-terminal domain-containing protein [Azospirillum sp. sgz302134]